MTVRPVSVGLFVTCLVDLFRPTVGFAAVRLLEEAGCRVSVPKLQTCCGQPAYNSGDHENAVAIARDVVAAFRGFDYVVAPSGSCAGMIKVHYPALFAGDPKMKEAVDTLASRTYELVAFLTEVMGMTRVVADFTGSVTYHDSCSGLRELGIKEQPRKLLASMPGLTLKELPGAETCCGFGGTFAVKYGEVSSEIARRKAKDIVATGAETVLAGDLGCLLNMAGSLSREGANLKVRHVAEVLAGMAGGPAIGEPSEDAEPGRR